MKCLQPFPYFGPSRTGRTLFSSYCGHSYILVARGRAGSSVGWGSKILDNLLITRVTLIKNKTKFCDRDKQPPPLPKYKEKLNMVNLNIENDEDKKVTPKKKKMLRTKRYVANKTDRVNYIIFP